jgi:hypothetical protein
MQIFKFLNSHLSSLLALGTVSAFLIYSFPFKSAQQNEYDRIFSLDELSIHGGGGGAGGDGYSLPDGNVGDDEAIIGYANGSGGGGHRLCYSYKRWRNLQSIK